MGYLGFLTAITDPQTWQENFIALLEGHYWIEERMMMNAQVLRDGASISSHQALNDVVISRDAAGTILLQLYIDGDWATTYHADALIVASATGSTAYALAVGGPILPPELRNFLIVPVAPHLSMDRPIVLSEGANRAGGRFCRTPARKRPAFGWVEITPIKTP
jgi:NAD+ kinase